MMAHNPKHIDLVRDPIVLAEKMINDRVEKLVEQLGTQSRRSPILAELRRRGIDTNRV